MLVRRLTTVAVGAITTLALGAGAANAHFCYFKNGNEDANAKRVESTAIATFAEYLEMNGVVGLCDEGVAWLADQAGATPDTLMNTRGVMAGPTDGNKAIGHLDHGAFALIGDAYGVCEAGSAG